MSNSFEGKQQVLDELLALCEAKGVTPAMLDAWAIARGVEIDRQEAERDMRRHGDLQEHQSWTVWDELDSQIESNMEECGAFVEFITNDWVLAVEACYGKRPK